MTTVLIVDDEMLIRWSVAESLVEAGFDVVEACSAREAIDRLTDFSGAIDVTILDLRLPDSTGFSLLRRILAMAPACRVILITADGTPGILTHAIDAGAFSALAKPFDMHVLSGLVRQAAAS